MENHTVSSYDSDLVKLRSNILKTAMLVKDVIVVANKSLQKSYKSYTDIAYDIDTKINELDEEIEIKATSILALRQPMAIDLRESIAALKIAVILERIGDLAKNISSRVDKISVEVTNNNLELIQKMSEIIINMIEEVIIAYENSNIELTRQIYHNDSKVDAIHKKLMSSLEAQILNNPKDTSDIMQIIFAIKNLERIGDYIAKIASLIYYIITGNRKIMNE